jgi:predicted amidohydrolase YtcJ
MAATAPDLVLINGQFTTLDRANPSPEAVAVTAGRFSAVGDARARYCRRPGRGRGWWIWAGGGRCRG